MLGRIKYSYFHSYCYHDRFRLMKFLIVLSILFPVFSFAQSSFKEGWSDTYINASADGCAQYQVDAIGKDYIKHGESKGDQNAKESFRKISGDVKNFFMKTCLCTVHEVAQTVSFDEYMTNPAGAMQLKNVKDAMSMPNGKCAVDFAEMQKMLAKHKK